MEIQYEVVHCGVYSLQRANILYENCGLLYSSTEQGLP